MVTARDITGVMHMIITNKDIADRDILCKSMISHRHCIVHDTRVAVTDSSVTGESTDLASLQCLGYHYDYDL